MDEKSLRGPIMTLLIHTRNERYMPESFAEAAYAFRNSPERLLELVCDYMDKFGYDTSIVREKVGEMTPKVYLVTANVCQDDESTRQLQLVGVYRSKRVAKDHAEEAEWFGECEVDIHEVDVDETYDITEPDDDDHTEKDIVYLFSKDDGEDDRGDDYCDRPPLSILLGN